MVITVTLNPAMDKTLTIDNFTIGDVNRVIGLRYDIGGKGINVSKVLKNFGVESICTGFLGGILKNGFELELRKREIKNSFINISQETRTNTKIVDQLNGTFTDVNEPGPNISEIEMDEFLIKFKSLCQDDDIVVLSGGVGPSIEKDIYRKLIKIAKGKGAFVILDADGELLKEGIKENPDVIKPNDHELELLLNKTIDTEEKMILEAKKIIDGGVGSVLISMGHKGAMYITKNNSLYCNGLKVPVKSTVGAGDSMVAALVYSKINKFSNEDTLRYAAASGTAAVCLEGTEACNLDQVNEFIPRFNIENKEEF
ncbi:1-phosphofructokinase [Clostridium akagii]|uniref:1-phosphofructokinase n=1 Tax=Clostridium akagii TaxID=91623 RepID=UPI000479FAAD|nr:1-phosphofructokinase [Clostridium akagii]